MTGSRRRINPTVAGTDKSSSPRRVAAREERISLNSPRATWAAKVGRAAVAIACAITNSGMVITIRAILMAERLPALWLAAPGRSDH